MSKVHDPLWAEFGKSQSFSFDPFGTLSRGDPTPKVNNQRRPNAESWKLEETQRQKLTIRGGQSSARVNHFR
jgi:hypothetical protein